MSYVEFMVRGPSGITDKYDVNIDPKKHEGDRNRPIWKENCLEKIRLRGVESFWNKQRNTSLALSSISVLTIGVATALGLTVLPWIGVAIGVAAVAAAIFFSVRALQADSMIDKVRGKIKYKIDQSYLERTKREANESIYKKASFVDVFFRSSENCDDEHLQSLRRKYLLIEEQAQKRMEEIRAHKNKAVNEISDRCRPYYELYKELDEFILILRKLMYYAELRAENEAYFKDCKIPEDLWREIEEVVKSPPCSDSPELNEFKTKVEEIDQKTKEYFSDDTCFSEDTRCYIDDSSARKHFVAWKLLGFFHDDPLKEYRKWFLDKIRAIAGNELTNVYHQERAKIAFFHKDILRVIQVYERKLNNGEQIEPLVNDTEFQPQGFSFSGELSDHFSLSSFKPEDEFASYNIKGEDRYKRLILDWEEPRFIGISSSVPSLYPNQKPSGCCGS